MSTLANECVTNGYRPGLVMFTSKIPPPPAGTDAVWIRWRGGSVTPALSQARSSTVPTMWKSVSMLGPASTT